MRVCRIVCRGRFSSMLDMGGMSATSSSEMKIDRGKNNKLRLVALDFEVITKSIQQQQQQQQQQQSTSTVSSSSSVQKEIIQPDMSMVQSMANLLNIKLGQDGTIINKKKRNDYDVDDVSKILNDTTRTKQQEQQQQQHQQEIPQTKTQNKKAVVLDGDIRTKYASKLRSKLDGGLAGVDLAKSEKERAISMGDASAGHFAARQLAISQPSSAAKGKRWMATTGTGNLLTYLSNRSMQIALLPIPNNDNQQQEQLQRMEDLTEQLPNVTFHLLVKSQPTVASILESVNQHFQDTKPLQSLVVSDREEYLKYARDMGMFTCRLRPLNQPRGNVTTDYTIQNIAEVQDVVNDINGISFHTVFSLKQ